MEDLQTKVEEIIKDFAIPENLDYYRPEDYMEAQKLYVWYRLGLLYPKKYHEEEEYVNMLVI